MFPDADDDPSHPSELLKRLLVASAVPFDLLLPVFAELVAPPVEPPTMPEVSVHENRDFESPKHQIGLAGQMGDVSLRPPPSSL